MRRNRNHERRPILKLFVRKLHAQGKITRAEMRQILDDEDMADAVLARAGQIEDEEEQPGEPRSLGAFFQWLMDHKDQIIAFIKEIIALFGGMASSDMAPSVMASTMNVPLLSPSQVASMLRDLANDLEQRAPAA